MPKPCEGTLGHAVLLIMHENQPMGKQWWAPVWKGLVMDVEAKHLRKMKNAVWLYLYLLLNANRRTGVLMRKIATVSADMGVSRDTALRWFNVLRSAGYVETVNTGRSLTIQITRWKAITGLAKNHPQNPDLSNIRKGNHATPGLAPHGTDPLRIDTDPGSAAVANEKTIQIKRINDMRQMANKTREHGFTGIGEDLRREGLVQELAKRLNDPTGIQFYRSYAAKYPERLLRNVLAEVEATPPERITKGRGALFNYLVQLYGKGTTENSRD